MQKSCEQIAEMLVDYADGLLSQSKSGEVAKHLAKCEHCRNTLKALRKSLRLANVIWEDGLAETKTIPIPVPRKSERVRRRRYAAIAASILILVTTSIIWRGFVRPPEPEPTFAESERSIEQSASAARLLAATDLLAEYPDAQPIVKQQYRYIVETYPDTPAAAKAKLRSNNL